MSILQIERCTNIKRKFVFIITCAIYIRKRDIKKDQSNLTFIQKIKKSLRIQFLRIF
jgi:hypothetical protein